MQLNLFLLIANELNFNSTRGWLEIYIVDNCPSDLVTGLFNCTKTYVPKIVKSNPLFETYKIGWGGGNM